MSNTNQRARTLAVAMLVVIVIGVLAFGRRKTPHGTVNRIDSTSEILLRHPLPVGVEGQTSLSGDGRNWQQTSAPTAIGTRPLAPIPAERRLIALPPGTHSAASQITTKFSSVPRGSMATRTHRIVEGDSLEQLAEHYLGSRERFLELFEANRHILARPDVLPLGERLVIPFLAPSSLVPQRPTYNRVDSRPLMPLDDHD